MGPRFPANVVVEKVPGSPPMLWRRFQVPHQCGGEGSRFPTNVVEEVPGSSSVWWRRFQVPHQCGGEGSRFPISVVDKVPGSPSMWWSRFQVPHHCGGRVSGSPSLWWRRLTSEWWKFLVSSKSVVTNQSGGYSFWLVTINGSSEVEVLHSLPVLEHS